jgi:hypothetical protein
MIVSIKDRYLRHQAWRGILSEPKNFPKFSIADGLIFRLADSGDPLLMLPDAAHQGEKIIGIAIEHAHGILGHLGSKKTLDYMCKHYWWSSMSKTLRNSAHPVGSAK